MNFKFPRFLAVFFMCAISSQLLNAAELKLVGVLETRDHQIQMLTGGAEPVFTISTRGGDLLVDQQPQSAIEADHAALMQLIEAVVAEQQGHGSSPYIDASTSLKQTIAD